jgi:hypothetical protein
MKRLFRLWAFGLTLLSILSPAASGQDCVKLKTPEVIDILEGDRQVEMWWRDAYPESLTCIFPPRLGTTQAPWRGNASLTSGGFYTGACDFEYRFTLTSTDLVRFRWTQVNWLAGTVTSRVLDVIDTDTVYDLSDGITVSVPGEGLSTITDSERWTPNEDPAFHGIYRGGSDTAAQVPVVFTLTCSVGGEVTTAGGSAVIDWVNNAGASGSIQVETAGADYEMDKGLLVNFPAGSYAAGDTLVMEAPKAFVSNDQFAIRSQTFEGYQVLRRSVEDRPDVYKVVANFRRCDTAEFFYPVDATRYFIDRGIFDTGEGVTPDPDAYTVINGFPYEYAVVTYDVLSDPSQPGHLVRSPIEPVKVHPTPPVGSSVRDVYVVPNPYLFSAGWEEGTNGGLEAKLQFMNVPLAAEIRIYDTNGDYIQTVRPEMKLDGETQSGRAEWNLKNAGGRDIVSGVYIYRVTAGTDEKIGRFIVVR